jgi:KDO2-lipid IV(A) lauroyltransferase
VVYRNFNNPYIDHYIRGIQRGSGVELIRKGAAGARRLIKQLREGQHTIMLVDQRMNDGIPVPFFGRDAMTAPAIAELAHKYDAAIVPVHVERLCGARFRVTVEPPLPLERSGDRHADVARTMTLVNQRIEAWVRARPEQWLWLHRRWPDGTRAGRRH